MSLNYLLDGYNIINRIPMLCQNELEDSRLELIRFLEVRHPQGRANNDVLIVFDGQPGIWNWDYNPGPVKIVFSAGESADDYIKRYVSEKTSRRNIVVVTDDKEIRFAVRSLGAKVLSVDEFMGKPVLSKTQSSKKDDHKTISKVLEHKITKEFEDIWLKKSPRPK